MAFLLFHGKLIFGAIILGAISTWIYFLAVSKDNNQAVDPSNGNRQTQGPSSAMGTADSGTIDAIRINLPEEYSYSTNEHLEVEAMLQRGNKSELLDYCIKVKEAWQKLPPFPACVMLINRLKVTQKLMEMELSGVEQSFVLTSLVESVSLIDSLNIQKQLGLTGVREAMGEIDKLYANHELPEIAAKANLAYVIVPGYELVVDNDVDKIGELTERLNQRGQFILADLSSTEQLCEVILGIKNKGVYPERIKEVALVVLDRIVALGDEKFDPLIQSFTERIYFGGLEFDVLLGRIAIDDSDTRQKVESLFSGLESAPDVRIGIYSTAATFIRVYIQTGDLKSAENYLGRFKRSAAKVSNREAREEILRYAAALDADLAKSQ